MKKKSKYLYIILIFKDLIKISWIYIYKDKYIYIIIIRFNLKIYIYEEKD